MRSSNEHNNHSTAPLSKLASLYICPLCKYTSILRISNSIPDREKGKYFKINNAPGASSTPDSKYSKHNVKKLRRREHEQHVEKKQVKRQKRERLVQHTDHLSRALLQRELGDRRQSYLTHGLWPNACVSGYEAENVLEQASRGFRYFDRAPASNSVYASLGESKVIRQFYKGNYVPSEYDERRPYYYTHMSFNDALQRRDHIAQMTSPISSLNYLPASGSVVITTAGTDRPPVIYFADPDRDGPHVGVSFTPHSCNSIHDASPQPNDPVSDPGTSILANIPETVAVALAGGRQSKLQLYTRSQSGDWSLTTPFAGEGDFLSLCWLTPTMLTIGQRNGRIQLVDTRAQGSAHVLSHSTPITHIRRGDDFSRIVCSGICNTLAVYDIRGAGTPSKQQNQHQKRRLPFRSSRNITTFAGYQNESMMDLGMDVSTKLGLVAAAGEENKLKIWNMYTGELVKTFSSHLEGHRMRMVPKETRSLIQQIRCVRFMEEEGGEVSLWANVGGGVVRYGW